MAAVLISHEVSKEIMREARPKYIEMNPTTFEIEYPSDPAIQKELKRNPLLRQEMADAANKDFKMFVLYMVKRCKEWDRSIYKTLRNEKKTDQILSEANKEYQQEYTKYAQFAENSVGQCWTNFKKKNVEYKNYRWKTRTKVGLAIISLIAGIASVAASIVSAGATIIVSVGGILKGAASLYNRIKDMTLSLEQTQEKLKKVLRKVKRRYEEEGGRGRAKEAGSRFINHLVASELKTFKEAERLLDLLLGKIAAVQHGAKKAVHMLEDALNQSETLNARENGHLQPKELARVEAMERQIDGLIRDTIYNVKRISKASSDYRDLEEAIKAIKGKRSVSYQLFEDALAISEFAFSTGWSDLAATAADLTANYTAEKIIDRVYR